MNNRYLLQSAGLHFAVLALLFFSPWLWRSTGPAIMIEGFEYEGGGGGGSGGGPKPEQMGQVVPQPVKQVIPSRPAPVQHAQKAEETWKVKEKVTPKAEKTPAKAEPAVPVQTGEKEQKETTNVIRRGVAPNTAAGKGGFDFGTGEGQGAKGVGIGFGEGEGSGMGGFGGYLRIVRQRIWSEWTQSAVYGSNEVCIVGLTIHRDGDVTDISVEKPSGNGFYDSVALRAVRNASPLPPLPDSFPRSEQRFRIQFRLLE